MKSIAQAAAEDLVREEWIDALQPDTPEGVEETASPIAEIIDRHIAKHIGFGRAARTEALLRLVKVSREDGSDSALIAYVKHLEAKVASYAPTHMAEVWRENERLKAVVAKLPKTKDGVPVTYNDEVFCVDRQMNDIRRGWVKTDTHASMRDHKSGGYNEWPISDCYSARKAAAAALAGEECNDGA